MWYPYLYEPPHRTPSQIPAEVVTGLLQEGSGDQNHNSCLELSKHYREILIENASIRCQSLPPRKSSPIVPLPRALRLCRPKHGPNLQCVVKVGYWTIFPKVKVYVREQTL